MPVKLLWIVGNCLWCPLVVFLWWRTYEAQTFSQASLGATRFGLVSALGVIWAIAGSVWLARRKKTPAI